MNLSYYWLSFAHSLKKVNAALDILSADEIRHEVAHSNAIKELFGDKIDYMIKTSSDDYLLSKLDELYKKGITLITREDKEYPDRLKQQEVNPPLILYCKGDVSLLLQSGIAIVGTRICSRYGKEMSEKFAQAIAMNGLTVISGLATGIDAYAHTAALKEGKTIAVLGGGFDNITPIPNLPLADKIEQNGLLVSEYSPEFTPTKYSFPERNRIISGLSLGVLVIEAGEKSGSLITANYALEQNREVFAVPGNIGQLKSVGTNNLIKNGQAMLVTKPEDIFSAIGLDEVKIKKNISISLDFYEKKLYNFLLNGEKHFDEIISAVKMSPTELSPMLISLEIRGVINRLPGNYYKISR